MEKIAPEIQGRVFASNMLVVQVVSAIAFLIAGPLANRMFEPAMQLNRHFAALFSPIVGIGAGAGIVLLYLLTSIGLVLVGVGGYISSHLQTVEQASTDQEN